MFQFLVCISSIPYLGMREYCNIIMVHKLVNPLTTTGANKLAHAVLVITRHLLQLERCSNPLRIQQV